LSSLHLDDYKSIEGVRIGMTLDAAVKRVSKDCFVEKSRVITYESERKDYEYIVYSNKTKKETLFIFNEGYDNKCLNKVFRLVIKSPKYYTQEGICVGMSMRDLKEKTRLKTADFNYDDGLFIISDTFDGGYWMDLDMEKYKSYNFEESEINTLPGDIKIKAIIIF
jgi:hypothetical protein